MKKTTLFLFALFVTFSMTAQVVVETKWSFSLAGDNLPVLPNGGTWSNIGPTPRPAGTVPSGSTRNFAVGTMGGNERVFIFTRRWEDPVTYTVVEIYNAITGAHVGQMNTTGVSGGTLTIGDGDVTEDGKLLMSNLAVKATFKVYMWENETAAPKAVINFTIPGTQRYGDKLFVEGNYSTGTAKVYATNKAAIVDSVLCWSMIPDAANPGQFVFNQIPTGMLKVAGLSAQSNITTIPSGGFYYKESGKTIVKYDENGVHKGVSPDNVVRLLGTTPRFVGTEGGDDVVAYFRYYHDKSKKDPFPDAPIAEAEDRVELLRIPGGDITLAQSIIITPSLGRANNVNGWGDVVTKRVGNDVEVYVISGYNGFAKYLVKNVFVPPVSLANWSRTVAGENPPTAGEANVHVLARNFAAGMFNGKDRIFAPYSNKTAADVYIFDAGTGAYAGNLNVEGVAALGTARLSDGDVTEDGKLLLSNLARNAEIFQVYKWENESAAPELVIDHQLSGTERYGDKVLITGNYKTGTAKVYATTKEKKYADVKCWSMIANPAKPGTYKFDNTPTNAFNVYGFATQSTACPIPGGGFYYKEVGMPISKYDAAGDSVGETNSGVARFHGTAIRYVYKDGNDDIIAYFRFRVTKGDEADPHKDVDQEYVDILRVPNGDISEARVIASTPSLGAVQNLNGWSDLVVRKAGNDLEVFYYSVNNGFAKHTIENFLTLTSTKTVVNSNVKLIKNQDNLQVEGVMASEIQIYNTLGQKVKTSQQNNISVAGLSGVYIVSIKVDGKLVQTTKVLL